MNTERQTIAQDSVTIIEDEIIGARVVQQLAESAPLPVVIVSETDQVLRAITAAALNPDVDIEKLERMRVLYNDMRADAARAAYNASLVEFGRLRKPIPTNRMGAGPGGVVFPYADWPQMESHLSPWLAAVGLAIQFTIGEPVIENKNPIAVMVKGRLSHRDGHVSEAVPWYAVVDERVAGKLSPSQAIQQPITYAKRRISEMLLGLSSQDESRDDDGNKPTEREPIRQPERKSAPQGQQQREDARPQEAPRPQPSGGQRMASEKQCGLIKMRADQAGIGQTDLIKRFSLADLDTVSADKVDPILAYIKSVAP